MEFEAKHQQRINWLRKKYFSNPDKQIRLKKGEALLRPGQFNEKLFLILHGALVGYIEDSAGELFEIFQSGEDNLVGAYSFFSESHQSYSTVLATEEPTIVAYLESVDIAGPDYSEFANRILPVLVDEIYIRQLLAQRISMEKQEAMKRLYESEKLATLGQLAAGLAHELNNAIGVIQKNAEWLAQRLSEYISEKDTRGLYGVFEKALREGQPLSSAQIRERRKEFEKRYGLETNRAKELAKMGLTCREIDDYSDLISEQGERIRYYFETGLALHDMLLASGHASQVVRSVRELGATGRLQTVPTDINETIHEALALLKKPLQAVIKNVELQEVPITHSNPGDWVQVWVNIIKNACEAMAMSTAKRPEILIRSRKENGKIIVTISDNGPGISEENLEKIFQPSFTTKKDGLTFGLGLGLSIVQKIVQSYNGTIEVESRPGNTIFRVMIPVEGGRIEELRR